jgi:hypothetical protein
MRIGTVHGSFSRPLPTALAAPDNDEVLAEVHVLEVQAEALQKAQAAAIEPPRHEGVPACYGGEQPLDLRLREHGRQPWVACASDRGDRARKGCVQDIPVEKNQGVQGLPLVRRAVCLRALDPQSVPRLHRPMAGVGGSFG